MFTIYDESRKSYWVISDKHMLYTVVEQTGEQKDEKHYETVPVFRLEIRLPDMLIVIKHAVFDHRPPPGTDQLLELTDRIAACYEFRLRAREVVVLDPRTRENLT